MKKLYLMGVMSLGVLVFVGSVSAKKKKTLKASSCAVKKLEPGVFDDMSGLDDVRKALQKSIRSSQPAEQEEVPFKNDIDNVLSGSLITALFDVCDSLF